MSSHTTLSSELGITPVIYIASTSVRRYQLLDQLGVGYLPVELDKEEPDFEPSRSGRVNIEEVMAYVRGLARWKVTEAVNDLNLSQAEQSNDLVESAIEADHMPVLGADTVIFCNGRVLEKPRDRRQACTMLQQLSGRTHRVLSAVALGLRGDTSQIEDRLSVSDVTFLSLSEQQIDDYLDTEEYKGKAGAYAIQGYAAAFIEKLNGSYSGVMGLPLCETAALLHNFGIPYWERP